MSPLRTLLIPAVFALCVGQIGGQISKDSFNYPKSPRKKDTTELNNEVRDAQSRETEQDSGKVGDGALVEIVAEVRTEVRALKSELRGVQLGLSECAAARADARRAENDHVLVQWMQREMAETRSEIAELARGLTTSAEKNSTVSSENDLGIVKMELSELSKSLSGLEVKVERLGAAFEEKFSSVGTATMITESPRDRKEQRRQSRLRNQHRRRLRRQRKQHRIRSKKQLNTELDRMEARIGGVEERLSTTRSRAGIDVTTRGRAT